MLFSTIMPIALSSKINSRTKMVIVCKPFTNEKPPTRFYPCKWLIIRVGTAGVPARTPFRRAGNQRHSRSLCRDALNPACRQAGN